MKGIHAVSFLSLVMILTSCGESFRSSGGRKIIDGEEPLQVPSKEIILEKYLSMEFTCQLDAAYEIDDKSGNKTAVINIDVLDELRKDTLYEDLFSVETERVLNDDVFPNTKLGLDIVFRDIKNVGNVSVPGDGVTYLLKNAVDFTIQLKTIEYLFPKEGEQGKWNDEQFVNFYPDVGEFSKELEAHSDAADLAVRCQFNSTLKAAYQDDFKVQI